MHPFICSSILQLCLCPCSILVSVNMAVSKQEFQIPFTVLPSHSNIGVITCLVLSLKSLRCEGVGNMSRSPVGWYWISTSSPGSWPLRYILSVTPLHYKCISSSVQGPSPLFLLILLLVAIPLTEMGKHSIPSYQSEILETKFSL